MTYTTVAIQVCTADHWDACPAVFHQFKATDDVSLVAYAISRQHGNISVRVTYPMAGFMEEYGYDAKVLQAYVGRLNGHYYQADPIKA